MPTVHDQGPGAKDACNLVVAGVARRAGGDEVATTAPLPPTSLADSPGLVLCDETRNLSPPNVSVADALGLAGVVVGRAALAEARAEFRSSGWDLHVAESPNPRLLITPGSLVWTRTSMRQDSRSAELARVNQLAAVDAAAQLLVDNPDWRPKPGGAKIAAWSAKSRANMYRTLASIDYAPLYALGRVPAMVTLTYPADWRTVAPDAEAVKEHLDKFRRWYERTWSEPLIAFWKLEFQARGAPHFHLFMVPPHGGARVRQRALYEQELAAWEEAGRRELLRQLALGERWGDARKLAMRHVGRPPRWRAVPGDGLTFKLWLSVVWAAVVNHPDADEYVKHLSAGTNVDFGEGLKVTDPKRLAVYFGKHGTYRGKEYQHVVPEAWSATGRWWGYWHLRPMVAVVELAPDDYRLAKRIARRHAARHKVGGEWLKPVAVVEVWRRRIDYQTGEVVYRKRKVKRRVRRLTGNGGFLMVNNGPAIAKPLARAIAVCGERRE